jgi:hypothetical protein
MHQIHACVRFQQVAPDPFARMRLARDQQHAQPVAHAVDLHDGGVVAVGQLALGHGHLELQHVHPAMRQAHGQFQILAHGNVEGLRVFAIDRDGQFGQSPQPAGTAP